MGIKKYTWERASFSLKTEVIDALNSIPRSDLPNKSFLVQSLIIQWLYNNKYIMSGSL